ncbi:MAG: hypothetical protein NW703_09220 [Nitrospiraceae bacterium]
MEAEVPSKALVYSAVRWERSSLLRVICSGWALTLSVSALTVVRVVSRVVISVLALTLNCCVRSPWATALKTVCASVTGCSFSNAYEVLFEGSGLGGLQPLQHVAGLTLVALLAIGVLRVENHEQFQQFY